MSLKEKISNPMIKNTLKLSVSNVLMYMIPFIVTPILSRLYGPDAFGEWGVFSSVLIIANIGIMLGYENAIVKAETEHVANVSFACFIISIITSTLIFIVFLLGEALDIDFFISFPSSTLLYICLLTSAFSNIFSNISNRFERYNIMSFASIFSGVSQAVARILFGTVFLLTVYNGLILGTTLSHIVVVLFYVLCLSKVLNAGFFEQISKQGIADQLKKFKQFPIFDAPSSILAFAAFNLPIIILSSFFNMSEIGCFSIIIQLLLLPMSFIGTAMGRVYYRQLSDCKDDTSVKNITLKVLKITSVISTLPMLFIVLGGDFIIVLFLGDNWGTAGNIALCLSLWSLPTILTQPLLPLLRIKNKMDILFKCNILYFILGIGIICVSLFFTRNLYLILLLYSISCFIAKMVLFKKMLNLSHIYIQSTKKFWALWLFTITVLIVRLFFLFL